MDFFLNSAFETEWLFSILLLDQKVGTKITLFIKVILQFNKQQICTKNYNMFKKLSIFEKGYFTQLFFLFWAQ